MATDLERIKPPQHLASLHEALAAAAAHYVEAMHASHTALRELA